MPRRSLLAILAVVFAAVIASPSRAAEPDYSDIWWGAGGAEAGWGVNFAQSPGFIFATFFIYGPDNKQVWVSAEMVQTGTGRYSGAVYRCTGTYFALAWVPGDHGCAIVGEAQFVAESVTRGQFNYRVDTVQVSKTIERLALTPVELAGVYLGGMLIKNSNQCNGGGSTTPYLYQLVVSEAAGSQVTIDQVSTDSPFNTDCTMKGVALQVGRVRAMPNGTYTCGGADSPVSISDLRRTSNGGIELAWTANLGNGCTETGSFSGVPQQ
ncbi:MAG TPA: hypothetical protein VFQ55_13340 [Casimicrobiaceae bacterium]|jgi:hypothetical protein|nr:hypothetical protein [Casimicrobiaceae bacterium]